MLINEQPVILRDLTFEEINLLTPIINSDEEAEDEMVVYETDSVIDIEGMKFTPTYECEVDDEYGSFQLQTIYLEPVESGEQILEKLHAWKNRITEKYDCDILEDCYEQPDYTGEICYPDNDDGWTLKLNTNAFNFDYEVRIEID